MELKQIAGANGSMITIEVDRGGLFSAVVNNERIAWGKDLEKVEASATRKTKTSAVRVEVPFVMIEDDRLVRATAHGQHATNNDVLGRSATGKPIRLPRYERPFAAMTDEELAEGQRLYDANVAAREAWSEWQSDRRYHDLHRDVANAVRAKEEAGD